MKLHSFTLSASRPLFVPHRFSWGRYSSPKKHRVKYSFSSTNRLVYRWGRMYAVAMGTPHSTPKPPQEAVMVLQCSAVPAVMSIH